MFELNVSEERLYNGDRFELVLKDMPDTSKLIFNLEQIGHLIAAYKGYWWLSAEDSLIKWLTDVGRLSWAEANNIAMSPNESDSRRLKIALDHPEVHRAIEDLELQINVSKVETRLEIPQA